MSDKVVERPLSQAAVDPLPTGLFPGRSILEGQYVRVEPLHPSEHLNDLWTASHDGDDSDRLWDYMGYGPFPDPDAFKTWLRGCSAASDPVFHVIRDKNTGNASGMASYLNIRPHDGVIEVGHIWLGPALQRTRAATEGLYLLIRHAMDDLGYRRMEWKCNALNDASRAAARRLGFAYEGTFYQATIAKGRNRDTAWFSILDGEWPAIRANFETWLSADNFDGDGRQITSLGEMNHTLRQGIVQ